MTDLIPRDAAIAAMTDEADRCDDAVKWGGSRRYVQDCKAASFALRSRVAVLRAIPAIDPAAIREDALREAAAKCADYAEAARKKLGASETREEANAWALIVTRCDLLEDAILAPIGEKK